MPADAQVFLARQPILDRRARIVGHEILYRAARDAPDARFPDASRASLRVMRDVFASLDVDGVLGSGLGFFNVNAEVLESDLLEALPPSRVVLEILEDVQPTTAVANRCRQLRRRGFQLALDDWVADDPRTDLLDLVHVVKVDLPAVASRDLVRVVARLRGRSLRLLAEKVETHEDHGRCRELGFDLFQGFYFARPVTLAGRSLDPARATVMELLRMLARQAGIAELSGVFKHHAELGLTLLKIVNSVEFARRQKIRQVEQALVLLGERRLRRWLSLLLFAGSEVGAVESPLLQTAALRGRLMELLARHVPALAGPEGQSCAFLAGMLSLADVVLGMPLPLLVGALRIEPEIADALLDRKGPLGDLLGLVECLERAEFARVEAALHVLGVAPGTLRDAEVEAMRWAAGLEGAADPDPR